MVPRMRAFWQQLRARGVRPLVCLGYGVMVVLFIGAFSRYYIPEKGFSYLVSFGGKLPHPPIDALKNLEYYVEADSDGYDAQYYVQIAMEPSLRDPQLREAVDSLPYRARRILISWVSYVMGFGKPAAVLNAYVLQNAISWLLLAGVLWWWFPPTSWSHWLRWTGVLFGFGMCFSLRNSLVDGPSLFLIATGVLLLEKGHPWWSTAVLGISGLGKETNLLGAAALLRGEEVRAPRRWPVLLMRGLLVAVPLAAWLYYIQRTVGPVADVGLRNFDWPFMGFARKWFQTWVEFRAMPNWDRSVFLNGELWSFLMMVTFTVQFAFLMLRPEPGRAWWRVGMSFAVLMIVLGDAVWEGYPGAASRVLLPMQLAFNVLVPKGGRWLPVLLLGNLTLLNAPVALQPPPGDSFKFVGPDNLIVSPEGGRMRVQFDPEWHKPERLGDRFWRWSRASSKVMILNPHAFALEVDMTMMLSALEPKEVIIVGPDQDELWRGSIQDNVTRVNLAKVYLAPGKNALEFRTNDSISRSHGDPRQLAFCLKDWNLILRPAPRNGSVLMGPAALLGTRKSPLIRVDFATGWHDAERFENLYWRWTRGPAELVIDNATAGAHRVTMRFVLNAISKRTATLTRNDGIVLWEGEVSSKHSEDVVVEDLVLNPGENRLIFKSSLPPGGADDDTRLLDLSVKNLVIEVYP